MEALNQLEEGLKDNIKQMSSFEKYKQEVLLGHLDWSPVHKDSFFWRDNINSFEENDFQVVSSIFFLARPADQASYRSYIIYAPCTLC